MQPWDRQENESSKIYDHFCIYLYMGPQKRTLEEVSQKVTKSLPYIKKISSDNSWVERAAAWDEYQNKLAREAHQKEIADFRKLQSKIAKKGLEKIMKYIDTMDPEELNPATAGKLADSLAKMGRIAMGDVGEVIEERDGGKAEPAVQFYMPDNKRDAEV